MIEVTEEKFAHGHSVHCISVTCSATAKTRTLPPLCDADIPNDAADLLTNCFLRGVSHRTGARLLFTACNKNIFKCQTSHPNIACRITSCSQDIGKFLHVPSTVMMAATCSPATSEHTHIGLYRHTASQSRRPWLDKGTDQPGSCRGRPPTKRTKTSSA